MDKRAFVLVSLILLSCVGASTVFAAGIQGKQAARTVLTLGGTNVTTSPPIGIGSGGSSSLVDRVLIMFPGPPSSPVNRFDWSRWFNWMTPVATP